MFAFYSNRLGCLGSIAVSIVLSIVLVVGDELAHVLPPASAIVSEVF